MSLQMEMREMRQDVLKVMEDRRKEGELPQGTLVRRPCSITPCSAFSDHQSSARIRSVMILLPSPASC